MAVVENLEPRPTAWDLKFSLLRVPIRVSIWYWLVSLLFAYRSSPNDFRIVLIIMACMFVSILVHEFGHIFCQKHYGDRNNHIVFWMLGGLAIPSIAAPGMAARIWISLWGPFAGFILGAIVYAIGGVLYGWDFPLSAAPFGSNFFLFVAIDNLFWFNVAWGLMNLMPILPLDGGNIMRALADRKRKPQSWGWQFSGYVGLVIFGISMALAFFVPGVPYIGDLYVGIFFLILGIIGFVNAWQIRRMEQFGGGAEATFERREAWEQDPDWWKK
ncbi:MAG TPA: site-2 protease family protein [Planctomycetota bacterium]|nr:site-2 protease family protein [Planctomycetota bacterium]